MLGAPGVYFLSYLGCVGRMVSGFCTMLLVRVPPYSSSSCWSATTKTLHRVRVETTWRHLRLETLPSSTCCTFVIFCWCFCCRPSIDCHRVVALYSFDQKLVWVRSIVLLCCHQDGLLFSSTRRLYLCQLLFCFGHGVGVAMIVAVRSIVVFVLIVESYSSPTRLHAYTPTPRSIDHA
jgi:hypothetical protein